jgi:hypothetical protein
MSILTVAAPGLLALHSMLLAAAPTAPPPKAPAPAASPKPQGGDAIVVPSAVQPTAAPGKATVQPTPKDSGATPVDPFAPDLKGAWGYTGEGDLTPNYSEPEQKLAQTNPIGYYSGVALGSENPPPIPPQVMGTSPSVLTWSGFQRTATGSRVFFQLSAPVEHVLTQDGLTVTVRLPNTAVNHRNNRRALHLQYFNTPVERVSVARKGPDSVATIRLKRESAPVVEVSQGANGYKILSLEFRDF